MIHPPPPVCIANAKDQPRVHYRYRYALSANRIAQCWQAYKKQIVHINWIQIRIRTQIVPNKEQIIFADNRYMFTDKEYGTGTGRL